jgi:hypothetical protein
VLLLLLPQGITYAESTGHFLAVEEVCYHENAHTQPASVAAPLNEKHSVQPQPAIAVLLLLPQGITYVESTGHFLAVEEVRYHEKHDELHPFTHELRISDDGTQYDTVQVIDRLHSSCICNDCRVCAFTCELCISVDGMQCDTVQVST